MRAIVSGLVVSTLIWTLVVAPGHISLQAQPAIIPIGSVQGVTVGPNCRTSRSPFAPATGNSAGTTTIRVQGVIYQRTRQRSGATGSNFGFFIQNTAATRDSDPNSSDGIFVFTGSFETVLREDGGPAYTPKVGDEIVLSGRVSEFFFLTQISSMVRLVSVLRSGVNLDELPAFEAAPPDNMLDADCFWERREGMRAHVVAGSIVTGRRQVFASNSDAEVWVIHPDNPVARRFNPFTRRAFRDPHPLDNNPAVLFDDGNGYRILLASHGIKFALNDVFAYIAPARTFDRLTGPATGGVYFAFNKYSVMPDSQILLAAGVNPAANGGVPGAKRALKYSVVTFNVENLYDFRDDPFDGCDFTGNAGCPGVNPPFDYVPASQAAYTERLHDLARQIMRDLRSPDIILIQEAEDQDICAVIRRLMSCSMVNNADGKPDTLQELALAIRQEGGPEYDAAVDRDGADDRGITSAYLFRTDRVELSPANSRHPVLGATPTVQYRGAPLPYNSHTQNPKALNAVLPADVDTTTGVDGSNVFTRAPQVALFRIWRDGPGRSVFTDLYIQNNHFSSTPDARVGQRKEQAAYNAAIVAALQQSDSDARIIVGGDLNVFPRPDDPFAPGHPLFPSDQLAALYNQGLTNLWDRLVAASPVSAYSYVFDGQAQTLDQFFVTGSLLRELTGVHAAHINSDWPIDHPGDGPRGPSDHDPQAGRFRALTVEALMRLVRYDEASGAIQGQNTARILLERLQRAARFRDSGQESAYTAELRTFERQVEAFTPQQITPAAAEVLTEEADWLADADGGDE